MLGETVLDLAAWEVVTLMIGVLWWRTEASEGADRRAMLWLVLGAGVPGLLGGQVVFLNDSGLLGGDGVLVVTAVAAVWAALAAVVIGMSWPTSVDVRRVIAQAARYLVSLEVTIAVYAGVPAVAHLVGLGSLGRVAPTLLLSVLALTFHPLSLLAATVPGAGLRWPRGPGRGAQQSGAC